MQIQDSTSPQIFTRYAGAALLSTILIGIISAVSVSKGIDINMSSDVTATAANMLEAEIALRAKAYIGLVIFVLEVLVALIFFLLLRGHGLIMSALSLVLSLGASVLVLFGAVFAMNAAEIASHSAYLGFEEDRRLMLAALQATSDYTSFHLGLIIATTANIGFFYLFFKSNLIPKIIAGWGIFASVFVVTIIVARDFIPALGSNTLTMTFMLCNLAALVSLALYLVIKGVRVQ